MRLLPPSENSMAVSDPARTRNSWVTHNIGTLKTELHIVLSVDLGEEFQAISKIFISFLLLAEHVSQTRATEKALNKMATCKTIPA